MSQTPKTAGTPEKTTKVFKRADVESPLASSKKLSLSSQRGTEAAEEKMQAIDLFMTVPEDERPETAALVHALARNSGQSIDANKEIFEAVRSAKTLFTPDMSIADKQKIVEQVLKIPKEHRSNAIKIAEEHSSFFNGNTGVRVRSKPEMLEAIGIAFGSLQNLFTEKMSDQNKREIISKGTEALSSLLSGKGTLTPKEMNTKLAQYNTQLERLKCWEPPTVPSLFSNIHSPARTQLSATKPVHGNWLNGEKSFAGFMYPTRATAPAMLETLMSAKIDRHVQLANPFVVWLQHPETGPVFPMSTEAFEQCQKNPVRTIQTERGPITVTYGKVETDDSGQKVGTFTIASERDRVTREGKWPLDSLPLNDDLRLELQSTGNFDTYVYKNGSGESVHSLQVGQLHWNDMEGTSLLELHKNASWLAEAENRSVNCRAGVGRTGTLFVATMMREWVKDHPGEALTQTTVLKMIAEGRRNRDPQVVQTESQIKLLNDYMLYLNCNNLPFEEAIANLSRAPETAEGSNHNIGKNLKESGVRDILTKKERTAEDEVKLDQFYSDNSVCPITLESFTDPVVLNSGRTYERSAIEQWRREGKTTCPMTRMAITEVKEDIFTKSLMTLIGNRALETLPTTEAGKAAFGQIQQILVKEPHHWCRVLSAVMPKNSYIVREKGMGGANEFVIELRGKTRVQKCSFSVNSEGLLQPGGQSDVSFKTPDQLAAWLIGTDKTNVLHAPPKMLTEEAI
ncbi:MAG: hypothetical protein JSR46_07335, partial [Verrucomicrobia bacterium]|nr:hypothetical protein [Verrucomicrobiota bacterium]